MSIIRALEWGTSSQCIPSPGCSVCGPWCNSGRKFLEMLVETMRYKVVYLNDYGSNIFKMAIISCAKSKGTWNIFFLISRDFLRQWYSEFIFIPLNYFHLKWLKLWCFHRPIVFISFIVIHSNQLFTTPPCSFMVISTGITYGRCIKTTLLCIDDAIIYDDHWDH